MKRSRGRPRKHTRNVTGLRNHGSQAVNNLTCHPEAEIHILSTSLSPESDDELTWDELQTRRGQDEPKDASIEEKDDSDDGEPDEQDGEEADVELEAEIDCLCADSSWDADDLQKRLVDVAMAEGDNPSDKNWLPYKLRKKKKQKIGHPKAYGKGPDVMNKSVRTQQRYRKTTKGQKKLTTMGFQHIERPRDIMSEPKSTPDSMGVNAATASPSLIINDGICVHQESVDIEIPAEIHQEVDL